LYRVMGMRRSIREKFGDYGNRMKSRNNPITHRTDKPRSAKVPRCNPTTLEVEHFSTYAPKAIGMIGKLTGKYSTLSDRSIILPMKRKGPRDRPVKRLRLDRLPGETDPIRGKIARWVQDNEAALRAADPETPAALGDREADNWRPLLAIADTAGGLWPKIARKAAITLRDLTTGDRDSIGTICRTFETFSQRNPGPGYPLKLYVTTWQRWKSGPGLNGARAGR